MTERGENAWAVVGGIFAGLVAAGVLAGLRAVSGLPLWIGGVATHLAVSVGWGVVFGIVAYGMRRVTTVAAGALCGAIVWLVMVHVVLPLVGREVETGPVAFAIAEHVVFGLALGLGFLPFQRHRRPRVVDDPAAAQQILPVF